MKNFMLVADLVPKLDPTDYVGFTFFVGCMVLMGAHYIFYRYMLLAEKLNDN